MVKISVRNAVSGSSILSRGQFSILFKKRLYDLTIVITINDMATISRPIDCRFEVVLRSIYTISSSSGSVFIYILTS